MFTLAQLQAAYPQLAALGLEDSFTQPLAPYAPLIAALAPQVLVAEEDEGNDEGHRYWLLSNPAAAGQRYGVLIFARYFNDDPGLDDCREVFDALETAQAIARRVFWTDNLTEALGRINRRLANQEQGHGKAADAFRTKVRALAA